MAIQSSRVPRGDVHAELHFYNPPADGAAPYNLIKEPVEKNYTTAPADVLIKDVRGRESSLTLDHDSVAVVSSVPDSAEKDFVDDESIKEKFYPEVEALLLKHVPGANRVVFFDHTIRRSDPNAHRGPVLMAHIDQTAKSVALRVRRHLGDEADELLKGRYRIINVWRPLNANPVESFPLAFASSASVDDKDIIPVAHIYPSGYEGQTAAVARNPEQEWLYLSGMTGNERLLLQCFDSEALKEGSSVKGGRLPHTAFTHPGSPADAEGRESIEVRALVFGP
ncbi:related to 7alpha-cephem-methoxylase P8 chain [Cephalotrichum gorgonifer]|uniref:Related to 7alpha-cephem-methoxylase P8 chain n=1 Tax=Cephalotrichum gorgonifer TaxID=2041049 RepID=A0AAE8N057_9PEZI|nr:related to 7alpha-cephem-methoxylase P8 chain [Cephalotrichum gorgonifer]